MVAVMVWEMSNMKLGWELVLHHNALIAYVLYTNEGQWAEREELAQARLNAIAAVVIFGAAMGVSGGGVAFGVLRGLGWLVGCLTA